MRSLSIALLVGLALAGALGCRFIRGPAGFWHSYRTDLIVDSFNDQGPWGGERWILWQASSGVFQFPEVVAFAESRGWRLVAHAHYEMPPVAGTINIVQGPEYNRPTFLEAPSRIGRFDSGWLREEPGTSEIGLSFGYLQVTDDGRHMYVYHFWGNG